MQMLDSLQPGQEPQQPAPAPQAAPHRNRHRLGHIKMLSKAMHRLNRNSMPNHPQDHQLGTASSTGCKYL